MEKLQLNTPDMYADHHVLKVRATLTGLNGVQDVIASSAFRMVAMSYDPTLITPSAIASRLAEAGYPVTAEPEAALEHLAPVQSGRADPAWDRLGVRVSSTDERDARIVR